jgi:hypothetical protein
LAGFHFNKVTCLTERSSFLSAKLTVVYNNFDLFRKQIEHLDPGLGVKWNSKTFFLFFEPFSDRLTSKFTKSAFEKEQKLFTSYFQLLRRKVASAPACCKACSGFKCRTGTLRGFLLSNSE